MKLSSGRPLFAKNMKPGKYAVYGGNGINGRHDQFFVDAPILVIGRVGAYCGAIHVTEPKSWVTDNALYVTEYLRKVDQDFLALMLEDLNLNRFAKVGGQPSVSQGTVLSQAVCLPTLSIQHEVVAEIKTERALVEANRELARRFEQKLQIKLSEIWGDKA